jgi:hypothetical protein
LAVCFALVLGAGLQMQPQTATPPPTGTSPVTQVMVILAGRRSRLQDVEADAGGGARCGSAVSGWQDRPVVCGVTAGAVMSCTARPWIRLRRYLHLALGEGRVSEYGYIPVGPFSGLRVCREYSLLRRAEPLRRQRISSQCWPTRIMIRKKDGLHQVDLVVILVAGSCSMVLRHLLRCRLLRRRCVDSVGVEDGAKDVNFSCFV